MKYKNEGPHVLRSHLIQGQAPRERRAASAYRAEQLELLTGISRRRAELAGSIVSETASMSGASLIIRGNKTIADAIAAARAKSARSKEEVQNNRQPRFFNNRRYGRRLAAIALS